MEDLTRAIGDLVNLPHGVRAVYTVTGEQIYKLDDLQACDTHIV
jgi:hypothetical protein